MTILDRIAAYKRDEIAAAKAKIPEAEVETCARAADRPRGFRAALLAARVDMPGAKPIKGICRELPPLSPPRDPPAAAGLGAARCPPPPFPA